LPKFRTSEVSSDEQGCPGTTDRLFPNPIAEDNPDWDLMVQSIATNKTHKKQSKKMKEAAPSVPLRKSVRFEEKGGSAN